MTPDRPRLTKNGALLCPKCGATCERDEIDNGVGMEACGPWGCPDCHWFQEPIRLDDDPEASPDAP